MRKDIVGFLKNVVVAVNALHEFGLAHLDIRIDNKCFTRESNIEQQRADLDRSIPYNKRYDEVWKFVERVLCAVQCTNSFGFSLRLETSSHHDRVHSET